jgi:hypothetical protein
MTDSPDGWTPMTGRDQTWAVHVASWYDPEHQGMLTSIDVRFLESPTPQLLAQVVDQLAGVSRRLRREVGEKTTVRILRPPRPDDGGEDTDVELAGTPGGAHP